MNRITILIFAMCMLAGAPVRAQPATLDPAEAAYQEGRRLYDLQEWEPAIAKFKDAYKLRPDAKSLYNIAQSYRLKGDCTQALSFYKTYRRNFPNAENLAKVDKQIGEMEACVKAQPKTEPAKTEPTTATVTTEPPKTEAPKTTLTSDSSTTVKTTPTSEPPKTEPKTEPPNTALTTEPSKVEPRSNSSDPGGTDDTARPGRSKRIAGLSVMAVGVAAVGTGFLFGLKAQSKASDVESGSGTWDPSVESAGKDANRNAKILWGVGAAALVGGGVVFWLGHREGANARVALVPAADGALVVWGGRY